MDSPAYITAPILSLGPAARRPRPLVALMAAFALVGVGLCSPTASAVGTPAGVSVRNEVVAQFSIEGVSQPTVSRQVDFLVDELLDVAVVNTDVGPVTVIAPQAGAQQTYNVTNLGNGIEAFRLVPRTALVGDDFDTTLTAVHLESNGAPGLQLGAGGDELYIPGSNDLALSPGDQRTVYIVADVPIGIPSGDTSLVSLDAVPLTIVTGSGTDDATQPDFPVVGTSFVGLGDATAGTAVTAVVGTSFDSAQPTFSDVHDFVINGQAVQINKSVASVTDPQGGTQVLPGSVIAYQILVEIAAGTNAANVVVVDPLPGELGYSNGSLLVSGTASGVDSDDDFLPTGVDNTGFNSANRAIEVDFGDLVGPMSLQIDFQAIVQ